MAFVFNGLMVSQMTKSSCYNYSLALNYYLKVYCFVSVLFANYVAVVYGKLLKENCIKYMQVHVFQDV